MPLGLAWNITSWSMSEIAILGQSTEEDCGRGILKSMSEVPISLLKGDSGMRGFDRDTSPLHRSVLRNYFEHRAVVFRATHVGSAVKVASLVQDDTIVPVREESVLAVVSEVVDHAFDT